MARILRIASHRIASHKHTLRHLDKRGVRAADLIQNPLRRAANAFRKGFLFSYN